MKRFIIASLFFFGLLLGILCNSCDNANRSNQLTSSLFQKKIDSLKAYYDIASKTTNTKVERLKAISNFIDGAKILGLDSLYHTGLNLKANIFYWEGGFDEALDQSKIMLMHAKKINDSGYIGKAYHKLGFFYKKKENYLDAFKYLNQSFKIRRNLKDSINAAKSLLPMSHIQQLLGDHNACKMTATDGLTFLENSNQHKTIVGFYNNISISFYELENYKEALLWNNKSLDLIKDSIIKKQIRDSDIINLKNTRANILARQKKYKESIGILEELLKDQNVSKKSKKYAMVLSNLGYIKYLKDPENIESEAMMLEALWIRQEKNTLAGLFSSNFWLSEYYKKKDVMKALYHAKEAYKYTKINNNLESIFISLKVITELDPNSIEDHQLFKEASLNLMELRKKTREIYAPTRFENENLLKENELKNRKILQVRNQSTIYLLGMLLLLAVIGFFYYFFKQRTRYLTQQNKIVEFQAAYEAETRISKRLHDELGNDIFQVMMQYQHDPHDMRIPEKLNIAYNKARDISRENSEFEVGEEYPNELKNMLKNYTQNGIRLILRGFDKVDWSTIDKNIKITVYRVLQELMTNMQKHSKATLVAVVFIVEGKMLTIKYSDNGVGMSKEHMNSKNGLRNTEKRVEAIHGTLIFDSEKDKGFKAEIKIPN